MKKWLFPCNLSKYDILGSFLKNGFVDYGTKINLVNHIKLQEKGFKGFSFQVEISSEVGKYLDNI